MADNPDHYHKIERVTDGWAAFVDAARAHAYNTEAHRAHAQRDETEREVHVTGKPHSQKGG